VHILAALGALLPLGSQFDASIVIDAEASNIDLYFHVYACLIYFVVSLGKATRILTNAAHWGMFFRVSATRDAACKSPTRRQQNSMAHLG
jgi:hypothetical protein